MKARLVLLAAAVIVALSIAACGGGGSGPDPAGLAPPKTPLFIQGKVRPEGELKANVESLAERVAGVKDLGGLIVSELEKVAGSSGKPIDFEEDIEPWLGEEGGLSFSEYDGNDFTGYAISVETTDAGATREFIDEFAETDRPLREETYEGVEYELEPQGGEALGIIGDFLVFAEDESTFKAAVDASQGESLADQESFTKAISNVSSGSIADVYVDVGSLIRQSGGAIDPEARLFLESAGIEASEAIAVASLVPGSDRIEVDLTTDLAGDKPPSGDASELLGSLPASAVAAIASSEFGERFGEGIDQIDKNGIAGQVPPHQLKGTLKRAGIDLESIASSIDEAGVYVEGTSRRSLGGALVLSTRGSGEAVDAVSGIGHFLRAVGVPGITAVTGKASGFSIRSPELGDRPLVVAASGKRIAVAYGLAAANNALAGSGPTLSDTPAYEEGVEALGETPISGFVAGPAALRLAAALVPPGGRGFRQARPYLAKIDYVALGSEASGDLTTAKLIVGVGK